MNSLDKLNIMWYNVVNGSELNVNKKNKVCDAYDCIKYILYLEVYLKGQRACLISES